MGVVSDFVRSGRLPTACRRDPFAAPSCIDALDAQFAAVQKQMPSLGGNNPGVHYIIDDTATQTLMRTPPQHEWRVFNNIIAAFHQMCDFMSADGKPITWIQQEIYFRLLATNVRALFGTAFPQSLPRLLAFLGRYTENNFGPVGGVVGERRVGKSMVKVMHIMSIASQVNANCIWAGSSAKLNMPIIEYFEYFATIFAARVTVNISERIIKVHFPATTLSIKFISHTTQGGKVRPPAPPAVPNTLFLYIGSGAHDVRVL